MNIKLRIGLIALFLAYMAGEALLAQTPVTFPRVSPGRSSMIRIGFNDIVINYSSPGVKERKIWGGLVPYGTVWRAGANENTTISFTYDVMIEGQKLPAGTYGLHMIPTEDTWTIIFNNDTEAWGSFNYQEAKDVLRVKVNPQKADHAEWLEYGFEDIQRDGVTAYLRWDKLKVPFKISMDIHDVVLAHMQTELTSLASFNELGWRQAAQYCLNNKTHNELGLKLIEQSIQRGKNANNMTLKARLLDQAGKTAEAVQTLDDALGELGENFTVLQAKSQIMEKSGQSKEAGKLMDRAVKVANENELNNYGYQLMGRKKVKEAIEIFKLNLKRNPKSWNVYDSLADGYDNDGNVKESIKYYQMALNMAPDNQKSRIEGILTRLKAN